MSLKTLRRDSPGGVPSTRDNLERLLHGFREPDSPALTAIRLMAERLSAELAFQRG